MQKRSTFAAFSVMQPSLAPLCTSIASRPLHPPTQTQMAQSLLSMFRSGNWGPAYSHVYEITINTTGDQIAITYPWQEGL
uniref:Secreted protein n=1 Tax=Ascaris lumbricoides TaxID=6252 RepID=A0A0M3IL42_ASCLU